jgi:hypothetical protein
MEFTDNISNGTPSPTDKLQETSSTVQSPHIQKLLDLNKTYSLSMFHGFRTKNRSILLFLYNRSINTQSGPQTQGTQQDVSTSDTTVSQNVDTSAQGNTCWDNQ